MVIVNEELHNYVVNTTGTSRKAINIMAFIGVFIFGWLMAVVYSVLEKSSVGWTYLVPMIVILAISRQQPHVALWILAAVIYVTAWIHANIIFSRYTKTAKKRIAEITSEDNLNADTLLEKGLLQYRVLRDTFNGLETLSSVVSATGGDPELLNIAGLILMDDDRKKDAESLFERILTLSNDSVLKEQAKHSLDRIVVK